VETFTIGPHEPRLKPEDVTLTHKLWLAITSKPGLSKVHHGDLYSLALTRLARDFGRDPEEILKELRRGPQASPPVSSPDKQREPPPPPVTGP
jgi:hypothetical protein